MKDIDKLANDRAVDIDTPGDRFHDTFLSKYPQSQWPSFIDEIAVDLSADIHISDTNLDTTNFPRETGEFYRDGMVAAAGSHGDIQNVLEDAIDERGLGTIVYQLNQLSYQIEQADTGLENVQQAVEAVLEKLLTKETGVDFSTQSQTETGTIADIVMEMFSDTAVAREAETLVAEFEANLDDGLLARLDEPQMMTPLWVHQLDALEHWQQADYRGYADMATATGKTVLGLAAIALRYGNLHPIDDLTGQQTDGGRDRVLIVAHSDLILEQWRREFDRHLNIPAERTQGADEIELTWGDVHFRTPQRLLNQSRYPYDLVILDEAHHYATGSEWGSLLEHFDQDVLALSGSVDDAGTDSEALQEQLQASVGPEIKRYSITDAQADGVIPAFDWEVRYAPFETDDEFVELSRSVSDMFEAFRESVDAGEIQADRRLRTFDDVRTFSHTNDGKDLKRSNTEFRELSTGLFSRRMKRWHLAPSLDALVDVVVEHQNDHVVVLLDSNAQVSAVTAKVRERVPGVTVQAATSDADREALRDQLDAFDAATDGGVLVGTGDLLGEGVDIPRANVAVNMATGGVNAQLVQRIGRVLRNPTGDKHAHFYNVVGVPHGDAAIPAEDGRRLVEDAAEFCALGGRFDNLPGFASDVDLDDAALSELFSVGSDVIHELDDADRYEWPADDVERTHLNGLLDVLESVESVTPSTVLGEWSEYAWYESDVDEAADGTAANEARPLATTEVSVVAGEDDVPVRGADLDIDTTDDQDATVVASGADTWTVTLRGAGEATLHATHSAFQPSTTTLTVADAPDSIELSMDSVPAPDGFEYVPDAGRSADAFSVHVQTSLRTPVEGASISVVSADWVEFGQTGQDGVTRIEPGGGESTARVAVRHPEYGSLTAELRTPVDAALAVTFPGER